MKSLYIALIVVLLPKFALANACDNVDFNPEVVLHSSYGKLSYDFSKSVNEISALSQEHNQKEHFKAGGLALSTIEMNLNFNALIRQKSKTDICVVPKKIDVFLGYQNPTIFVANSYKENSCNFYVTLRHEQAHMQINKKTLEYFLPFIKQKIKEVVMSVKPQAANNEIEAKAIQKNMNLQYYEKIRGLIDDFKFVLQQEHGKLDNQSNYDYEKTLCK